MFFYTMKLCRNLPIYINFLVQFPGIVKVCKNIVWFCILSSISFSASADKIFVATAGLNQYGGEIGIRYLQRISDDKAAANANTEFVATSEVGWRNNIIGYIWKPWFGSWAGNTNLLLNQNSRFDSTISGNSSTFGVLGDTNWNLNLFQFSPFPFNASASLSRSINKTDYRDDLTDRYQIKLDQKYTTPKKHTTANALLSVNGQDSQLSGKSNEVNLSLHANHAAKQHNFQGAMEYIIRQSKSENTQATDQTKQNQSELQKYSQLNIFLKHYYKLKQNLSMENFSNLFSNNENFAQSKSNQLSWQLNNSTVWRPESEPRLTVSGGARLNTNNNETETETDEKTDKENKSDESIRLNLYSGVGFSYTPTLRFNGSINANANQIKKKLNLSSSQNFGVDYSPEKINWKQFDYNWYTGLSINNNISDDGSNSSASGNLGHTATRNFNFLFDKPIKLNLSNQFSSNYSTGNNATIVGDFNSRISLTYSSNNEGLYTSSQIAYNDDFNIMGAEDEDRKHRQTFSSLINGTYQLNRHSFLTSDLNFELTKDTQINGISSTNYSTSGYISYRNNQLFGVFRLNFLSRLTLSLEDIISQQVIDQQELTGDKKVTSNVWENRLTYNLGRFAFTSRLSITQSKETTNGLIMFEAKRRFGYF